MISFFWFSAVHFGTPGLHHEDALLPSPNPQVHALLSFPSLVTLLRFDSFPILLPYTDVDTV